MFFKVNSGLLVFSFVIFLLMSACNVQEEKIMEKVDIPHITTAVAVLHPTVDNSATGTVVFEKMDTGIKITADVEGLSEGKHGFHIHKYGDCTAEDATSAGGHFNPENTMHGAPTSEQRHVGDLGNLTSDEEGKAHLEMVDTLIAFYGKHSIIGRAVIIHAGEDDFMTQPTGNAGARQACGVVGIAAYSEDQGK